MKKEEIVKNILSHKYMVSGKCVKCEKEFVNFYNKKKTSIASCCCSEKCAKEVMAEKRKRNKERHHYQVFKDGRYYYIKEDGKFIEKRTHAGKNWILEEVKHHLDESQLLNPEDKIPEKAIKIIDKVSVYLYDDKHHFDDWKNFKEQCGVK